MKSEIKNSTARRGSTWRQNSSAAAMLVERRGAVRVTCWSFANHLRTNAGNIGLLAGPSATP